MPIITIFYVVLGIALLGLGVYLYYLLVKVLKKIINSDKI